MLMTSTILGMVKRALGTQTYVRHGPTVHEWDISGRCERPVTRELFSRPLTYVGRGRVYGPGHAKPVSLILRTRCRMCNCCKAMKAALWTARAGVELHSSVRTWFGTITLSPAAQHQMLARARQKLGRDGIDFDAMTYEQQFSARMAEVGREVTLWMKRVRKNSGAALRYLLVAEAHQSGAPHLHILVHETDAERPVRYRTLAAEWPHGFTKFNLCDGGKAVRYVCKYISKSAMARVRASLRYGNNGTPLEPSKTQVDACTKKSPGKGKLIERLAKIDSNEMSQSAWNAASLTDRNGGKNNGIANGKAGKERAGDAEAEWFKRAEQTGPVAEGDEPPF